MSAECVDATDFAFERLEPPTSLSDWPHVGAELALAYGRIENAGVELGIILVGTGLELAPGPPPA
jgi:hypothetical protein